MKKILFLIFVFCGFRAHAQDCFTLKGENLQEKLSAIFEKSGACKPFSKSARK